MVSNRKTYKPRRKLPKFKGCPDIRLMFKGIMKGKVQDNITSNRYIQANEGERGKVKAGGGDNEGVGGEVKKLNGQKLLKDNTQDGSSVEIRKP